MARRRWTLDRARRSRLAAIAPEQAPNHIARRVIVIERELHVREVVFWDWDRPAEIRRKWRQLSDG